MAPFGLEKLFGWWIVPEGGVNVPEPISFAPRESDDGAANITAAGAQGIYIDLDGTIRSEVELINRYRTMEGVAAIDIAVDEITSEVIVGDKHGVKIVLDEVDQSDAVKKEVEIAFDEVLDLLDFRSAGYNIFKRWYIDGRLYFHVIFDEENREQGIQELRYVDPRKIRKIRELMKRSVVGNQNNPTADAVVTQTKNEYYVFSDKGFNLGTTRPLTTAYPITGLKIAKDSIVHVTSGITDPAQTMTLSYIHKAIKPLNMFSTLKDAAVIYRLSRAPERRVWYIDVGNLPRMKAEEYVKSIMDKYRTKINYDITTGEIRDDRRFMTMLEDFWLPRKETGQGTKVDVLPPGTGFNQIDDILFFQKELYASLHVPLNRISQDDMYVGPGATEITRDEIRFGKFVSRLRTRFNKLFIQILEKQLVLKRVMSKEDFESIRKKIVFRYSKDNYFEEAKNQQVRQMRIQTATMFAPFVGRWISDIYVRKEILQQTNEDIMEIDAEIQEASLNPQYTGTPGESLQGGDGKGGNDKGNDDNKPDQGEAGVLADTGVIEPGVEKADRGKEAQKDGASGGNAKKKKQQPKKPGQAPSSDFKTVSRMLSRNK